jgi:hypothetical protein
LSKAAALRSKVAWSKRHFGDAICQISFEKSRWYFSLVDLFGESAHGNRDLDAPHIEEAAGRKIMPGVPVEAC